MGNEEKQIAIEYIENLRQAVDSDYTEDSLSGSPYSFRAMYGSDMIGGSTAVVNISTSDVLSPENSTVGAMWTAWGAYVVDLKDVIGVGWGYLLSGVGSLDIGSGRMEVFVNGKSVGYIKDVPKEGIISDSVKSLRFEFYGIEPYRSRWLGGNVNTVASEIDKYSLKTQEWSSGMISQIERMVKS